MNGKEAIDRAVSTTVDRMNKVHREVYKIEGQQFIEDLADAELKKDDSLDATFDRVYDEAQAEKDRRKRVLKCAACVELGHRIADENPEPPAE